MTTKVTAPNAEFDGKIGGVRFEKGVAHVKPEQHAELAYFKRQGYGIGGSAPEQVDADQQQAQAEGGAFVPDEKLEALTSKELKGIAKDLGVSGSGAKPEIAARIIEKRAENGVESIVNHDVRDGADRDGDGVQDATTTPAGGVPTDPAATAAEVAGASDHGSVREVGE